MSRLPYIPATSTPDVLVEPNVDADICGVHLSPGKLANFLYGASGLLVHPHLMQPLAQVDGVFARHHLVDGRLAFLLSLGTRHLNEKKKRLSGTGNDKN